MASKWIQKAIKRPGALRAKAKKAGALKDGINPGWLEKSSKSKGRTGGQARLAQTLKKIRQKRFAKK